MAKAEVLQGNKSATHVVAHPVQHDGKLYPRNSLIKLEPEHATRLEEMGYIKPLVKA